jgi:hypothetical protein
VFVAELLQVGDHHLVVEQAQCLSVRLDGGHLAAEQRVQTLGVTRVPIINRGAHRKCLLENAAGLVPGG